MTGRPKNEDSFDSLWELLLSRSSGLAAAGEFLARRALKSNGFEDVRPPGASHRSYGSLLASKDGRKYIIEVKTRQKYKTNGLLNRRYKLTDANWRGGLERSAAEAERRFRAKAHWIAVQIDLTGRSRSYSVYLGSLDQLQGRSGIPMDPSSVKGYDCLAHDQRLPVPGDDMQPTVIQQSLKKFEGDHRDPAKTAFVMMPFVSNPAYDKILKAIKDALHAHGIAAVRADHKPYHRDLFPNVETYVYGCGFGIAVFDRIETDVFNPNVALEVGYMMALGKPVCLLKDRTLRTLPADLLGQLYQEFDAQRPKVSITRELEKWARGRGFIHDRRGARAHERR